MAASTIDDLITIIEKLKEDTNALLLTYTNIRDGVSQTYTDIVALKEQITLDVAAVAADLVLVNTAYNVIISTQTDVNTAITDNQILMTDIAAQVTADNATVAAAKAVVNSALADVTAIDAVVNTALSSVLIAEANIATDLASFARILNDFDDLYLGPKAEDPTVDNDGEALLAGAVYWSSVEQKLKFYNGATWDYPSESAITSATAALASENAAAGYAVQTSIDATATSEDRAATTANTYDMALFFSTLARNTLSTQNLLITFHPLG